ncbi:hypothetical protein CK503_10305 [Aliifodinibius salipaludis]|uniref:Uncharacterized protein n=1 Tax=Fodinibius salipaludis TaxID=2032627 RepID=A0A2A2G9Q6_9BACT|nr:hypothetical protein [Aliifodinibius salipaludis]PAU93542.1 hypothetical protein CK503_10305 [Aliifodinibius salipaludis]
MGATTANKKELINWIIQLEDQAMIENVSMLKEGSEGKDWWNEISEVEKAGIKRGMDDVENGRTLSNEEFIKKHADRL